MKTKDFQEWTALLEKLTPAQRKKLMAELQAREAGDASTILIESRLGDAATCPHCGHGHAVKFGTANGLQRYRCHACKKTFNALTGTPLAGLRHKDKWLAYAQAMQEGASVRKAAAACEVHRTTSFRWRHRFLALPEGQQAKLLAGIAEADETFFPESRKGSRKLGRKPRKRGGKAAKRGLSEERICVLVARDRNGATLDAVPPSLTAKALKDKLKPVLDRDALLCGDGNPVYTAFVEEADIAHKALNLSAGVRVVDRVFHIQNVNAYHSRLKQWMGRFHGVATKYLPNYLGWRRLLEQAPGGSSQPRGILLAALGVGYHQQIMRT